MSAFETDAPQRQPEHFIALSAMKFMQEILKVAGWWLFVPLQSKQPRDFVIVKLVHFSARIRKQDFSEIRPDNSVTADSRKRALNVPLTSQSADAKARMDVETQLRSIDKLVTKFTNAPESPESSLMDGNVISVKDEWSFVVGNVGEKQGVKIGMPMRVMRGDQRIATLRVIDVRQRICGAVIQEMDSKKERIKVGDRLQVDAQSNVSVR
jgi:hypothetical protein